MNQNAPWQDVQATRRYSIGAASSEKVSVQIGQVANAVGLEASAIRFYEANGIVPAPARTPSGYRSYNEDDIELLRFVRRLRSLELPLDDVREIVALRTTGQAPCAQVREALDREAEAIRGRIIDLVRLRDEISRLRSEAAAVKDDWPSWCVCHVVDSEQTS